MENISKEKEEGLESLKEENAPVRDENKAEETEEIYGKLKWIQC